jgi:hypothetical protein
LKSSDVGERTKESYINAIERVFKYKENWNIDFKDYTVELYNKFVLDLMEHDASEDRIDFISVAIKKMRDYFAEIYPDEFDKEFLKHIVKLNSEDTKNLPARSLTPIEISIVKQFIREEEQEKMEYMFNIFYYLGIRKNEFGIYNPLNANYKEKCFKKGDKKVRFNEDIEKFISKVKGKKITTYMISYHFSRITEKLIELGYYEDDKAFTYDDIIKTRDKFFFTCPCCGRKLENISSNWVLAQYEVSNEKLLVCVYCKGVKDGKYNY